MTAVPALGDWCVVRMGETILKAGIVTAVLPSGGSVVIAGRPDRLGGRCIEEVHPVERLKGLWTGRLVTP